MGLFKKQTTSLAGIDYTSTDLIEYDGWVAAQYQNMSIRISNNLLETSIDNSNTFPTSLVTTLGNSVLSAYIYKNGNILLTTDDNKIYFTDINLTSLTQKIVLDTDGVTPYVIHTPVNSSYPGRYFYSTKMMSENDQTDIHVFANYCNVVAGAAPVNIYYTTDFGVTIKVAYKFGQNLVYGDDGTASGSSGGTLLGDATNTDLRVRHTHAVEYDAANDKWYCLTGDTIWTYTTPDMEENQWVQGTYTPETDTWSWVALDFGFVIPQTSRLKATECFFYDGYVYWSSDSTNVPADNTENGIWRSSISTFTNPETHEKLFSLPNYDDVITTLKLDPNTNMIVGAFATNNSNPINGIFACKDLGFGTPEFHYVSTDYDLIRLNSINQEGYFRWDTELSTEIKTKTLFLKLGEDLFTNL